MPQLSMHSPIGDLTLTEEDGAIVALDWGWGRDQDETPLLRLACDRLDAYFDGAADNFADLPLAPYGTPYRQAVWQALRAIPPGETRTYRDLAEQVGGSPRSVGQANGANPIPILIPCHRVVATQGLGGYSGDGGVTDKIYLLELEGAQIPGVARQDA
ncbi:methylated-DNA--[protein]-cysteine S-methyltransferase [Gluconacetobacter sp. 1b LMG 1731]|uniref:Methylated-DNA--protein-cysteine methyltransferase n=1 Tax=Gluconacetobacter dulcium TaxID=2729096 RepID=A0A7W4NVF5_9PROT|nr:methylated-DNA--[protein]-cysteine S-methyltransferase [Gluconacetobacter dulcium]MBB2165313.1 methylated-DNA--[protein]-cysteine S-methyltransferase [Gluconacetobacter dulcium]MBB2194520.1 methylated-DNA--[protein]-cysteine S-methyltransferase [Gluconacetobacter dulcium]